MPITDVIEANDSELYGAEVGAARRRARPRRHRAVGDRQRRRHRPEHARDRVPPYRRGAVAALMTSEGKVPGGQVDRGLLQGRPRRAVRRAARSRPGARVPSATSWTDRVGGAGRGLRPRAGRPRRPLRVRRAGGERLRAARCDDTDQLVGRLLDDVDPQRDAVMVVGPAPPTERAALTSPSVRAPGFEPGLLRSTTTQRRRLREPRRRRADDPHLLRARSARRDGGPAHGDRRLGRDRWPTAPRSSSTPTRTACSATGWSGRR